MQVVGTFRDRIATEDGGIVQVELGDDAMMAMMAMMAMRVSFTNSTNCLIRSRVRGFASANQTRGGFIPQQPSSPSILRRAFAHCGDDAFEENCVED